MSLTNLAPANVKRACEKAARSFFEFFEEEVVSWKNLQQCMQRERIPLSLEAVMDKLSTYLAFKEGRKIQILALHW